jgi:hypothetical protein
MQQTEIFVPKSLAMELRKKGFNERCVAYYDSEYDLNIVSKYIRNEDLLISGAESAPTYDQVIGWFASKGVDMPTNTCTDDNTYITYVWKNNTVFFEGVFNSNRQQSLLTAFEEALKLI